MTPLTDTLCLQCGLCCNGVLFADVRPERGDASALFAQHGPRVAQPCPAFNFENCQCALYADRPARCRKFECKQFLAVHVGKISADGALKKIRAAKKLAATVEQHLTALDFNDVHLPFSKRFQKCQRAAERGGFSPDELERLADLQLAVHKLNFVLAQDFYA